MLLSGFTSLHPVSYLFFLYQSPSSSLCMVFDSVSSNMDEVLSINPYANLFVFGDFELFYNSVIISNDPTQMVNFPTQIPDSDFHGPARLDLFISFDASSCSTMAFPPLGNSDHVVSFPLTFHQIHNRMPGFIA